MSSSILRCNRLGAAGRVEGRSSLVSRHLRGSAVRATNGRDETPEQALQRRLRESQRYEERVKFVHSEAEWDKEIEGAGRNLVVLEVQGESVCETGLDEQVEYQWKDDAADAQAEAMKRCTEIKHTFQRIARDCKDATFLTHMVDDEPTKDSSALCDRLGIEVLPTLQFWRNGQKIWEHKGAMQMDSDLAQGVLYYDGSAANGVKIQDFVSEIKTREQFSQFIAGDDKVLKVVNMALVSATPCIHVYPAMLALAKNFTGFATFARVMGDENPELVRIMQDYKIVEVPSFLFFRGGKEVGRHVGSSRADLIGQILQIQQSLGVSLPQRPATNAVPRRKIMRKV